MSDSKVTESSLRTSIPSKYLSKFDSILVKQVVITKQASSNSGIQMLGINNIAPNASRKLNKMGTSKIHKFKPSVNLTQALKWLSEYGEADSSIMFENNDCFLFERGKFLEFEGDEDEEDEEDNNNNNAKQKQREEEQTQEDEEEEEEEESDDDAKKNNSKPVETFQIGTGKAKK